MIESGSIIERSTYKLAIVDNSIAICVYFIHNFFNFILVIVKPGLSESFLKLFNLYVSRIISVDRSKSLSKLWNFLVLTSLNYKIQNLSL